MLQQHFLPSLSLHARDLLLGHLYQSEHSHETTELRKELWEKVKQHRDKDWIAYLHYRTPVVKRRNN